MKTAFLLTAAVLAVSPAPASPAMSGVPPEMEFWLLQVPPLAPANMQVATFDEHFGNWEATDHLKEIQFWLVQPTIHPFAEASHPTIREERTTTGAAPRPTEERSIAYPRPRPSPAAPVATASAARPADLTGAWATHAEVCGSVFVSKGGRVSFKENSELYGGGFIIEGNRISGEMGKCSLKSIRQKGDEIRIVAACSPYGVMVMDEQYSVRILGSDQISVTTVSTTGSATPGMDIGYVRCRF